MSWKKPVRLSLDDLRLVKCLLPPVSISGHNAELAMKIFEADEFLQRQEAEIGLSEGEIEHLIFLVRQEEARCGESGNVLNPSLTNLSHLMERLGVSTSDTPRNSAPFEPADSDTLGSSTLDEDIRWKAGCMANASDFFTPNDVSRLVREEIATRVFHESNILLGHASCWKCHAIIPVMGILSKVVSIDAKYTHEFRDGRVRVKQHLDPEEAAALTCTVLALHHPFFAYMVTDYQRGFLDWVHASIDNTEDLRKAYGMLKIEKRHSQTAQLAYYVNICPKCDAQQGDYFLQCKKSGPFHPAKLGNLESNITALNDPGERRLFLECGLMPLADIDPSELP